MIAEQKNVTKTIEAKLRYKGITLIKPAPVKHFRREKYNYLKHHKVCVSFADLYQKIFVLLRHHVISCFATLAGKALLHLPPKLHPKVFLRCL